MSKFHYLIDAGHGGIDSKGTYSTCPNWKADDPKTWRKMWVHNGKPIFEGFINRKIAYKLRDSLLVNGITCDFVHDLTEDTSLVERVRRANRIYKEKPNTVLLSIHSNAGGGKGIEIFTSPGETRSDYLAEHLYNAYEDDGKWNMRKDSSDGDKDKEALFYVLRKTYCPAVLVELLFFDNEEEAGFLHSGYGQEDLASLLLEGIWRIEKDDSIKAN